MATTFKKVSNNGQTTLLNSINNSVTSLQIQLAHTGRFPATGSFWINIYNSSTPSTYETMLVTAVSSNTWTVTRAQDSTSAASWTAGDVIELPIRKEHIEDLDTAVNTAENLLDGTSSLSQVKFANGGSINDANGNELIKFTTTTSAVNEVTLKNAATGNAPQVQATGGDSNIDIKLVPKGTGAILDKNSDILSPAQNILRQAVVDGGFAVTPQFTSSTPNDDTYIFSPLWNALTETNGAWTYSQTTDAPTGSKYALKAVKTATGANAQSAVVFFLTSHRSLPYIGNTASFTFKAKTTTGKVISNLRATLLSWSSTADSITSDVIGTWAQDGTDPTWATNWTSEKAGSNLALVADTYTTYNVENIAVDTASAANIALVIWVDDGTISTNDEYYIGDVSMNLGDRALKYAQRDFKIEEQNVFYMFKPLHSALTGVQVTDAMFASRITTKIVALTFQLIGIMRTTPTLVNTLTSLQSTNPTSDGQFAFFDWQAGAFLGLNSGTITVTLHKYGDTVAVIRLSNSNDYTNGAVGNITSMEIYGGGIFLDARL